MSSVHRERRPDELGTRHLQIKWVRLTGEEFIYRDWFAISNAVGNPSLVVEQRIGRTVIRIDLAELFQPNFDVSPTMREDSNKHPRKVSEKSEFRPPL